MKKPDILSILYDAEYNMTYHVLAYRKLSDTRDDSDGQIVSIAAQNTSSQDARAEQVYNDTRFDEE
jgi:hypothetical protein